MTKLIKTWEELAKVPDSENYTLDITPEDGNGWIVAKDGSGRFGGMVEYLSTHTFYGSQYAYSTELLQQYGFDVVIANWDESKSITEVLKGNDCEICTRNKERKSR